jgi:hypothetical protein
LVRVATGGDGTEVGGVNLWQSEWTPTHERITVTHPQHSAQRHVMFTYQVAGTDPPIVFAAAEFSNGVWGVYVPS